MGADLAFALTTLVAWVGSLLIVPIVHLLLTSDYLRHTETPHSLGHKSICQSPKTIAGVCISRLALGDALLGLGTS